MYLLFLLGINLEYIAIDLGSEYIKIAKSDFNGVPSFLPGFEKGIPSAISFKAKNSTITKLTNQTADLFDVKIGKSALSTLKKNPSIGYKYLPMTIGNNNTEFLTTDIMEPLPAFSTYLVFLLIKQMSKITNPITFVVPNFWTETQRDLIHHACNFHSIPVYTIIDEVTAISIGYSASKTQRIINRNSSKPYNVLFLDIGSTTSKAFGIGFEWDGNQTKCYEMFSLATTKVGGYHFRQALSQQLNISEHKAQKLLKKGSKNELLKDQLGVLASLVSTSVEIIEKNGGIDEIQITGGSSSNPAVMATIKSVVQNLTVPIKKEFGTNTAFAYGGVYSALQLSGYSPFPSGMLMKMVNKNMTLRCEKTHQLCVQTLSCKEEIVENSKGCNTVRITSDPRHVLFGVSFNQDIDLVNISNITFSEGDKPYGVFKMQSDAPCIESVTWCKNEGDCYPIDFKVRYPDEAKYFDFMYNSMGAVKSVLQKGEKQELLSKIEKLVLKLNELFEKDDKDDNSQKVEFKTIADDYYSHKLETYPMKSLNETYYKLKDLKGSMNI
ncbi:heat shock 70 kDa protein 4-like [Histomonas meleagridis]|uniref:heat shock 70 kDa protein 4-like n=1 Tax=Histomonas meleagridis TaxID=135588 RepID=UPI0035599175|nr:heat shock 70 kDa protein 4-like [Histomonas meleagridis]KAH0800034.1 heat shock 70 kDa protein 4-like [Histomonas meleagridis]